MNQTQVTEFALLGFSHGQPFLFALFLAIYLATLLGSSAILSLVSLDPHLHSSMYFFLSHLSCLDICRSSATMPEMPASALRAQAPVSCGRCLAQPFLLMCCAGHDRRVPAPALRPGPAPRHLCHSCCWLWGLLDSAVHTLLVAWLSFCGATRRQHTFCDVPLLLGATCSNTRPSQLALRVSSIFVGLSPFLLVIISYLCILATILGMLLATSRYKAFSTCSAPLLMVTLYFMTASLNYNRPSSGYSPAADMLVSVLYCIIIPMLNPLVYSLRNQEVWGALRKVLQVSGTPGSPGNNT